jgi:outer membrane receptor for ferrienterochelin and colicins
MLVQHNAGYIESDRDELTPQFFDAGLKLAYTFSLSDTIGLEINGGVKNLFDSYQSDIDRGPFRDSVYVYGPMMPRSFFLGINFKM